MGAGGVDADVSGADGGHQRIAQAGARRLRRYEGRHRVVIPTVAVVVPCLNDAALLKRCLRSFAAQSSPPEHVIVVDNGSTDNSAQVVATDFGAQVVREPRHVDYLHDCKNKGMLRGNGYCTTGPTWRLTQQRRIFRATTTCVTTPPRRSSLATPPVSPWPPASSNRV
ncbi:glycosyltransferase family 2 protein [Corynebacterium glaucum]|uniref:glycosyltransferase family 2 protein n=1 Tax=Corynebacterium glaucum TaxID=187491 RepID=UPI0025B37661|nr:glycosyltransferase [Corynebacterium glaucum]